MYEGALGVLDLAVEGLRDRGVLLLLVVAGLVVADLLDVLHGQRRAALRVTAGGADGRADQAAQVDAVVAVEAAVLGGDQRVLQVLRHLAQRDRDAVLGEQRGDDGLAVAGVERGRCGGLLSCRLHGVCRGTCRRSAGRPGRMPADVGQRQPGGEHAGRDAGRATSLRASATGWGVRDRLPQGVRVRGSRRARRARSSGRRSGCAVAGRRFRRRAGRRSCRSPSRSWTSAGRAGTRDQRHLGVGGGEPLRHPGVVLGARGDLGVHPQRRLGERGAASGSVLGQGVGGGLGPRGGERLAALDRRGCVRVRLTTTPASGMCSAESRSTK